ncbi:hypothetical protein [Xylanibacter ruminicola]|nr:hypothetical protein [Xylanibacter ruminicola]
MLFPIVGRLANDTLRINGREYTMKQHGFARDTEFLREGFKPSLLGGNIDMQTPNGPVFFKMYQNGSPLNYPYSFDLKVLYGTIDNSVLCSWIVKNLGNEEMHFQIGAHPAFNLPDYNPHDEVHGYFKFYDAEGNGVSPIITSYLEDGLRHTYGDPKVLPNRQTICPIKSETFSKDALLIEDSQVAIVALLDKEQREVLRVICPQAETFGLWAPNKPGCPFVCIEPWCGIADHYDFNGDILERKYDHSLREGESYVFNYMIQIA